MNSGISYQDAMRRGIDLAHEKRGARGLGINIYIIDRDIDPQLEDYNTKRRICSKSIKDMPGTEKYDPHSALIASIVGDIAPESNIIAVPVSAPSAPTLMSHVLDGLDEVIGRHEIRKDNEGDDYYSTLALANISMSLFSRNEPCAGDCPLCVKIDEAARAGILCVISAGKSVEPLKRYSLSCPGAAKSALTVGQLDKDLLPDIYCARGPTEDLRMKPELWTYASFTSQQRQEYIGTLRRYHANSGPITMTGVSYATAIITGASALLQTKFNFTRTDELKKIVLDASETRTTHRANEFPDGLNKTYNISTFWKVFD